MAFSGLGYLCPPLEIARLKSLSRLRTDLAPDRVKPKRLGVAAKLRGAVQIANPVKYHVHARLAPVSASGKTVKHILGPGTPLDGWRHELEHGPAARGAAARGCAIQRPIVIERQPSVRKRILSIAICASKRVDRGKRLCLRQDVAAPERKCQQHGRTQDAFT